MSFDLPALAEIRETPRGTIVNARHFQDVSNQFQPILSNLIHSYPFLHILRIPLWVETYFKHVERLLSQEVFPTSPSKVIKTTEPVQDVYRSWHWLYSTFEKSV